MADTALLFDVDTEWLRETVARALAEDLGSGDLTTQAIVISCKRTHATLVCKSAGVIAGLPVFFETLRQTNADMVIRSTVQEGAVVGCGDRIAEFDCDQAGILSGERTALNFLQRLSGVATLTAAFVHAAGRLDVQILDTRKTTPGIRPLERYAVRAGGGCNHRFGLFDEVMIKDNHIAIAGGITQAIERCRQGVPSGILMTVECDTLEQVAEALKCRPDCILLDNMDLTTLAAAVVLCNGLVETEASGGITLQAVAGIASTGVDRISVGALTHSAPAMDISLEVTK